MAIFLPQLRAGNVAASQCAFTLTDSDVVAWVSAGGSTSSAGLVALQTFSVGIKSLFGISTLNQKFDRLFIHAGMGTRASSRLCLASRSSGIEISSPGWTAFGPGYTGDGSASCFNWNWAPNAGPNGTQNSGCFGAVMQTLTSSGCALGNQTSAVNNTLINGSDASHMTVAVNDNAAGNTIGAVTRQAGRWHAERTGAAGGAGALYYNGGFAVVLGNASAARSAFNMYSLAYNNNGTVGGFSSDTIGLSYSGSAVGSANMAAWDALLSTLMHGMDSVHY